RNALPSATASARIGGAAPCTNAHTAAAITASRTSSTGMPGRERIGFSFMVWLRTGCTGRRRAATGAWSKGGRRRLAAVLAASWSTDINLISDSQIPGRTAAAVGGRPPIAGRRWLDRMSSPYPDLPMPVSLGTPLSPSATRVLLLGSGELGKEVAIELQRLGVEVIAADRYADAPAMQVAHRSHVLDMLDPAALAALIERE